MLHFFRKYERSFLLIVFAPTIIGLGITGTIYSVLGGGAGDDREYEVFDGDTITASEVAAWKGKLEQIYRLTQRGGRQVPDEEAFDFVAKLRFADRAGIDVTRHELADAIKAFWTDFFAQTKAWEEIQTLPQDQQQQKFWQLRLDYRTTISLESPEYLKKYREELSQLGFTVQSYERTYADVLKVDKVEEYVRSTLTVGAADVREAFEDRHHRRRVEYLVLSAEDHRPTEEDADEKTLRAFYDDHAKWFEIPRRASIEFLSLNRAGVQATVDQPDEDAIKRHYEQNPDAYRKPTAEHPPGGAAALAAGAPFGGAIAFFGEQPPPRPLEEVKDLIKAKLLNAAIAKQFAAKRVELATAAAAPGADFAKIAEKVEGATVGKAGPFDSRAQVLMDGSFEQSSELIAEWFMTARPGVASGVKMASGGPAVIARLVEVTPAKTPPFEDIAFDVRKAYLEGHEKELKEHYDRNTFKFKREANYKVEWVFLPYERVLPKIDDVTDEARLKKYHNDYASEFPDADGKPRPFEEVRDEVAKAVKLEDAKIKTRELMDDLLAAARKAGQGGRDVELRASVMGSAEVLEKFRGYRPDDGVVAEITADELIDHDVLDSFNFLQDITGVAPGQPAPRSYENGDRTGRFVAVVQGKQAEGTIPFDEAGEQIKAEIVKERGMARARERAQRIYDGLMAARGDEEAQKALLQKEGVALIVSPFFSRDDKEVEGLKSFETIRKQLFDLEDDGTWAAPIEDKENGLIYVAHLEQKEPADEATFKQRYKALRDELLADAKRADALDDWLLRLRLSARGMLANDEAAVREAWHVRHGAQDRTKVRYVHMFFKPDDELLRKAAEEIALERIKAVEKRLERGAMFEELARNYSEDPGSQANGGDLGYFGKGVMTPAFEEAAFGLPVGVVSKPIKTPFGFHLIKVIARGTGDNAGKIRAAHILMASGVEDRKEISQTVKDEAWAKAEEKAKAALARLEAGESFRQVAREVSDEPGAAQRGGAPIQPLDWTSPHELAVMSLAAYGITEIVTDEQGASVYWSRDHRDEAMAQFGGAAPVDRAADRAFFSADKRGGQQQAVAAAEAFVEEMRARCEARAAEIANDPESPIFPEEFRKLARERSDAPSARMGGSVGVLRMPWPRRQYGPEWLKQLAALGEGERSEIFKSEKGYHLLLVEGFETAAYEDGGEPWKSVAEDLLAGTPYHRLADEE